MRPHKQTSQSPETSAPFTQDPLVRIISEETLQDPFQIFLEKRSIRHQTKMQSLEAENRKMLAFWSMRTMEQHVRNGAKATGVIGAVIGALSVSLFTLPLEKKHGEGLLFGGMIVGDAITASPGAILGAITGSVKTVATCNTRIICHTQDRVALFCTALTNILPILRSHAARASDDINSPAAIFPELIDKIIFSYGRTDPSQTPWSDSSRELMNYLRKYHDPKNHSFTNASDDAKKAEIIISYLSETEEKLSTQYSKNQGKRLFNVIMDTLENAAQSLLPPKSVVRKNPAVGLMMLTLVGKCSGGMVFPIDIITIIGKFLCAQAPSDDLILAVRQEALLYSNYRSHTSLFNNATKEIFGDGADYNTAIARMEKISEGKASGASYKTLNA